jgi:hypothetical protein
MTYSPIAARRTVTGVADAISELTETLADEVRDIDGHDTQAAVFLREYMAQLRTAVSQIREQARRIGEGSVTG